ncbi:MAG: M14 family metallopeptidase [Bacillota bacterium]
MKPDFTRYYRYDELTDILRSLVEAYPDLASLYSIGQSREGREIWAVEITNRATGPGDDKPGVYLDGNTHAGEVAGSAVCLYTIWYLLEYYASDDRVRHLVDTRVFYVVPRITVDGSELYLTTPEMLRSGTRLYPETEELDGLYPEDIDGDGRILTMRLEDPDGDWKVSAKDPRLMVRRGPTERCGTYYRLYTEGLIRGYDGDVIRYAPPRRGLDFNRNYPTNWAPEHRQRGSGDYPFSEPEMRAIGRFYLEHPNIVTGMAYHTSGGVLLRPLCLEVDAKMDRVDLAMYKAVGEVGKAATGYPCKSVFEGFTADKSHPPVGSDLEWLYETLGIFAFEAELWDMSGRAGIPNRDLHVLMTLSPEQQEEDGLKLLAWNDRELGGQGFIDWKPFDHPQLGLVELGGWEPKFVRQNPPPHLLPDECEHNFGFNLVRAEITPLLKIESFEAESVGEGVFKLVAMVANTGYLPTSGTARAQEMKAAKPVQVELQLPTGAELVLGRVKQEIGHLEGRGNGEAGGLWGRAPVDSRRRLQWIVKGSGTYRVSASAPRAGRSQATVEVE